MPMGNPPGPVTVGLGVSVVVGAGNAVAVGFGANVAVGVGGAVQAPIAMLPRIRITINQ